MAAKKRFTIETVFRGLNRISGPMRAMGSSVSKFARRATKAVDRFDRSLRKANRGMKKLNSTIKRGAVVAVGGLTAGVGFLLKQFSVVENARAAFQPILGGAEKAREVVEKLNKTAATTPFRFEQLASAAQLLLGFGVADENNLVKQLRMLGDVAGGNAQSFQAATLAFAQIQGAGKANMQDINQLINARVPILLELSKMLNKTNAELRVMVERGEITGEVVAQAFKNMTSEGGMFFRGMEIASATLTGKLSTLMDNVSLTAAAITEQSGLGDAVKEMINASIEWTAEIRTNVEGGKILTRDMINEWLPTIKRVAKTVGFLAAAWVVTNTILVIANTTIAISKGVLFAWRAAVWAVTAAQWLWNIALTANPIGLIVLGITGVIAIMGALTFKLRSMGHTWGQVWDVMVDGFMGAFSTIMPLLGLISDAVSSVTSGQIGVDSLQQGNRRGMPSPSTSPAQVTSGRAKTRQGELSIRVAAEQGTTAATTTGGDFGDMAELTLVETGAQ